MKFEQALGLLRRGKVITRRAWAGRSDQLFFWTGALDGSPPDIKRVSLYASSSQWSPTREDILSEDWIDILDPDWISEPEPPPSLFRRVLDRLRRK